MADMFLLSTLTEAVVSHSIWRISELLIHEAPTLNEVRKEVEILRTELRRIQSFLSSPYGQQMDLFHDERVRNWVSEIRELACEIEDVIETYVVKANSSVFKPFRLRSLKRHINSIKAKLESCFESMRIYGIQPTGDHCLVGLSQNPRPGQLRRFVYGDEDDESEDEESRDRAVVGQEECTGDLKARLMEGDDEGWLRAVPVVGMVGLGKTTVAKKVYNDRDVKRRFECRAWVAFSRECSAKEIFAEILMQIGFSRPGGDDDVVGEALRRERERLTAMEEGELARAVKGKLAGKRFLVVFDDLWSVEDFDYISSWIFPRERRGSKVVFTTSMLEVASSVDPAGGASPIRPRLLRPDESWELLHRKAFPTHVFGERECPPEFEQMGREMVKKCGGLPLAIVVLGGLLRTRNSEEEWRRVQRDVNSHINCHASEVQHMLALNYHYLPFNLKPCFLYLGSFPEDWEIPRSQLIQLWIAEGLVASEVSNGRTMEETAEQYLRELVNRCMVHVGSKEYTSDRVKTCRLHRLTRDFCVSKARRDGFSEVIHHHDSMDCHERCKARRIAIHHASDQLLQPRHIHQNLRSLMHFDLASIACLQQLLSSKRLRLLRVLELGFDRSSAVQKCNVPYEIGGLIHLRYLGLRGGGRVRLPSSIENLRSLTTVNLRDNAEVFLPVEIFRLKRLKHLLLPPGTSFQYSFTWLTYTVSDTAQIQTLKYIQFGAFLLRNKMIQSELSSLRNLGVEFRSNEEVAMFLTSPNFKLGLLHSLHMSLLSRVGFSGLRPLQHCLVLSKLYLDGKLFCDCHDLEFLPKSLTKLVLQDSLIKGLDPMAALEKLPKLRFLRLDNAYAGHRMACTAGNFPKLETLFLFSMEGVQEWEIGLESMPNLKRVYIRNMPNLNVPQRLNIIPTYLDN